jgi:hypothetical protein
MNKDITGEMLLGFSYFGCIVSLDLIGRWVGVRRELQHFWRGGLGGREI